MTTVYWLCMSLTALLLVLVALDVPEIWWRGAAASLAAAALLLVAVTWWP